MLIQAALFLKNVPGFPVGFTLEKPRGNKYINKYHFNHIDLSCFRFSCFVYIEAQTN